MRVKSGFWSNRRLPKKVQTYCARHIQADSCTSGSFHTQQAPMLESPAFGLWLPFCLLTPCARCSPDSLTDWIQCGGEGSRSKPMALRLGWGSAALSCVYRYPWHGTLSITPTLMWLRSILGSCCVARYGGPLVGEKNGCLNKSNRQTTSSPVLDVYLQALRPYYCSVLKQHVTLTKLAHCLLQRQPNDQMAKIS